VEYQRQADNGTKYEILDLVQDYIISLEGRHGTKKTKYTAVRGFFKANRAELPSDDFNIKGDAPKVRGRLTPENLKRMVLSCKPVYRALYMCMFAGGMGQDEAVYWSNNGVVKLLEDLEKNPDYVRVDLRGRKAMKNVRPYYTILMGDALDELKKWMEERPRDAAAIFTNQFGDPITKKAIYTYWLRHMQSLGLVEAGDDSSHRTGRNVHELRDVFRTQWEKSPAAGSVAEFALGHVVDELGYNKAHLDEAWVVREFRKAGPMLNILTSGRPYGRVDESEVDRLRRENEDLRRQLAENENMASKAWEAIKQLENRLDKQEARKRLKTVSANDEKLSARLITRTRGLGAEDQDNLILKVMGKEWSSNVAFKIKAAVKDIDPRLYLGWDEQHHFEDGQAKGIFQLVERLAAQLPISRQTIYNRLSLLHLPESLQSVIM